MESAVVKLASQRVSAYLFILSMALLVVAPLLPNHYLPWLTFHSEFITFAGIWALLTAFAFLGSLQIPKYYLFLFLLALIPWIQYSTGIIYFSGDALISSFFILGFVSSVWLGRAWCLKYPGIWHKAFALCILVVGLLSEYFALYQWLQLDYAHAWIIPMRPMGRPFSNLGQPNNFATLLCLAMAATLYLRQKNILGRGVFYLLAIFWLLGMALTVSRTVILIFMAFMVWWLWKRYKVDTALNWKELYVAVLVYIVFLFVTPAFAEFYHFVGDYLNPENIGPVNGIGRGGGDRIIIYKQLVDAVLREPLWGYGWNQVSLAQISVAIAYPGSFYVQHSHNFILDILIWNGMVLGGLLLLIIFLWLLKRASLCRSLEVWYSLLCIVIVLTHGLTEYPHQYAFFLLPVGLLAGSVDGIHMKDERVLCCPQWLLAGISLIVFCTLSIVYSEYQKAEEDTRMMRYETAQLSPFSAKAPDYWFTQIRDYNKLARSQVKNDINENNIDWVRKVVERNAHPPALFRYALALYELGQEEEARKMIKVLCNMHRKENCEQVELNFELAKQL